MKKLVLLLFIFIYYITILNSSKIPVDLKINFVLSEEGENYFIARLSTVAIDEKGNIYVVDPKMVSILKFDKNGEFLKKKGRRGEGPAEFPGEPFFIEYSENKLYITLCGGGASIIYVFDTSLNYLKKIRYKHHIPFFHAKSKRLYIPNFFSKNGFSFNIMDDNGNIINNSKTYPLLSPTIYENYKKITIDNKGNFYIISLFEDKIEKWDKTYNKIWSKHLFSGLGIKYKKEDGYLIPDTKKCFWYNDITLDAFENIYILSGTKSKHNRRDIYVLSKTGKLLTTLTLPYKTSFIKIDNLNNLYTKGLEEELLRYKIIYN